MTAFVAQPCFAQATGEYFWSQGSPDVTMLRADEGFCFLTRVAGNFRGGGEAVNLRLDEGPPGRYTWRLGGHSQQQGVSARARCVRYRSFRNNSSPIQFTTGVGHTATGRFVPGLRVLNNGEASNDLWQTDSVCVLGGISGAFDGGGEAVEIWADPANQLGRQTLKARSRVAGSQTSGSGHCIFFGRSQRAMSLSPHPQAMATWENQGNNYTWAQGQPLPTRMIRRDEGVCYLTGVSGNFRGGGERVSVVASGDYWTLTGASQQQGVRGWARCARFSGPTNNVLDDSGIIRPR